MNRHCLPQQLFACLLSALLLLFAIPAQSADAPCPAITFTADTEALLPIHTAETDTTKANLIQGSDKPYGYQGKSCFTLHNASDTDQTVSIRMENPRIRHAELSTTRQGKVLPLVIAGTDYPLKSWKTFGAEVVFTIHLPAQTTESFTLTVGGIFAYNSHIRIATDNQTLDTLIKQQMFSGVLVGFIFALIIYACLLWIFTKDSAYFFLIGSTGSVTLLQVSDMGMLYPLWPDAVYWNNICSGAFTAFSTFCGIGLARNYLTLKDNTPKMDRFLQLYSWYLTLIAFPSITLENDHLFNMLYALPTVVLALPALILVSILRIRQQYSPAKLYLLALMAPIFAGMVIFLMYLGVLPTSQLTRAMPLLGTLIQLILFGYALGERINWIKLQKNTKAESTLYANTASETKKKFLSHISHELRTPLVGIIGLTEVARKNPLYDDNKPLIDGMNASAEKLLSATNTLLDHARIDAGKWNTTRSHFSLESLIEGITYKQTPAAQKNNVTIGYQIDKRVPSNILGDKLTTEKIIECLLDYSISSVSNGYILIKAEPVFSYDHYTIRIDIIDTGNGITADFGARMFDIFELPDNSTTRQQYGMGLGIALSKKLCDLVGGDIGYESDPQYGTVFWFTVPCEPVLDNSQTVPPSPATPTTPTAAPDNNAATNTILAAEDDEALQLVMASQLEQLQQPYRLFSNGKPLVEEYKKNPQAVSLILLDWNMPICNASQAIAQIRSHEQALHLKPVTIAVLSAYDKNSAAELEIPAGILFIPKPVTLAALQQLIPTTTNV